MKKLGYVPDRQFAFLDVEAEQKEEMLPYHRRGLGFINRRSKASVEWNLKSELVLADLLS